MDWSEDQFEDWLLDLNRRALPFVPLLNCAACRRPIEDEFVLVTRSEPPVLYHPECDREPADAPGWRAKRFG